MRWIVERKLAAIFCAEVYGYSRLMGEDEKVTLCTLTSHLSKASYLHQPSSPFSQLSRMPAMWTPLLLPATRVA
jgi:hypothetical protein